MARDNPDIIAERMARIRRLYQLLGASPTDEAIIEESLESHECVLLAALEGIAMQNPDMWPGFTGQKKPH